MLPLINILPIILAVKPSELFLFGCYILKVWVHASQNFLRLFLFRYIFFFDDDISYYTQMAI